MVEELRFRLFLFVRLFKHDSFHYLLLNIIFSSSCCFYLLVNVLLFSFLFYHQFFCYLKLFLSLSQELLHLLAIFSAIFISCSFFFAISIACLVLRYCSDIAMFAMSLLMFWHFPSTLATIAFT